MGLNFLYYNDYEARSAQVGHAPVSAGIGVQKRSIPIGDLKDLYVCGLYRNDIVTEIIYFSSFVTHYTDPFDFEFFSSFTREYPGESK